MTTAPDAVIAVGGSAGSLPPLLRLVADLPAELPAAVVVTIHRGERAPSQLAHILNRSGPLPAVPAEDGQPLLPGRIYVAPPSRHLLTTPRSLRLGTGPRVNRHRPAVDVLFASTARWAGNRMLALVLSGVLDDGAIGSALTARAGGRVFVQDPAEADFGGMPAAALAAAPGAISVPGARLGATLLAALDEVRARPPHVHHVDRSETTMEIRDSDDPGFLSGAETKLTRMACPECGGGLAQVDLPQISYFRCHVGHQYAPQTLAAAQAENIEQKLWGAVAALEEQAVMLRYLREAVAYGPEEDQARQISERAAALREQVREWTSALGEDALPS